MKRFLLLSLGIILFGSIHAQQRLTPELLWELNRVSGATVSPDGEWLLYGVSAYNWKENKGDRDLYLMNLKSKSKPEKVTDYPGSEFNAGFSPDGSKIAFLSASSGSVQLYEIDLKSRNTEKVSDIEGGISNFSYAPDMKHISFTQDVKLDKTVQDMYPDLPMADARVIDELMYRHWNQWSDYAYSHVFVMDYKDGKVSGTPKDIMEGERFDSPLNPFGGGEQIGWSADGKSIIYTCKKKNGKDWAESTNSDLYRYDLASGKTVNLTEGMMGYDMEPQFSPDGKTMVWLSMERDGFESDRNRMFALDLASGKKTDLTEGLDLTVNGLTFSSDGKTIYFICPAKGTYQLFQVPAAGGEIKQITNGMFNYRSVADAGDKLICTRQSMSMPTEIYAVDKTTGEAAQLTDSNKDLLDKIEMGKVEERWIETTDGKKMHTWVIYPPGFDPNKQYPTLLYCQGGPQSTVSQFFSYRWNFQLMAANDYIIVAPNRRGLPAFGREWNDQISGDWGGQCMDDYLSAIDEVSKEKYVDKDRLGAIGASFGGYSVYYLAGIHEKRFKTFIAHCGLYNLESWYATTEEMFFANWDIKGTPWDKPQNKSYTDFSPHKLVGNWDTPILVIHGEKDFRVPIGEGMQAFNSAQLRGIPSRFLYYPNEGHWVLGPQNGILWHRVFFEWLDKWLKE